MRKKIVQILLLTTILTLSGCGEKREVNLSDTTQNEQQKKEEATEESKEDLEVQTTEQTEKQVQLWENAQVYEAETGTTLGMAKLSKKDNVSYIEGLAQDEDGVEFTVQIAEAGFYDINVVSRSADGGYKENYLLVDGQNVGTVAVEGKTFTDSCAKRIYLESGEHTITIQKYWGWIHIDKLLLAESIPLDESRFDIEPILVDKQATDNTKRLMTYLCDIYGTDILSGQYCDQGMYGHENAVIWKTTGGKYPAILGLDLIEYSPSRVANGSTSSAVEHAIEYWNEGGIVTFCWHWNAPEKYLTGVWYSGFYKEHTNIDLAKIMNGEDQEGYDLLMKDIDAIAIQLQRLQEAGVPILWRPLHEASGGWFWWGTAGADAYKELYKLLYDKLTNEHGLHNLIWVWNGQDKEWYPGDDYVDIIGEDIYPGEKVYTAQTSKYLEVLKYTDAKKMIVMSENGCLFDPDLAIRDGAMWGYFGTWGREFVTSSDSLNILSEQYTEEEMVKKVYAHEHVITRDELPDLKNYPLK